jgi:hypothetical protein
MIGAEFVKELPYGSYNLSTSPFTLSNMQGDLYNYHFIVFCDSASTTDGHIDITLNADTGTNYSRYYMRGSTSTASASVATSQTAIRLTSYTRNASSRNSLAMGDLTGASGANRKIHSKHSSGNSPQVYVNDAYWTNTVDEVTSMTFTGSVSASYTWHIMVYRTPKESIQGSWEYMKELNWSSETAEKSFSSLDGDTDIQYRLVWEGDQALLMQCNNDGGANYTSQRLVNSSGTLTSANNTGLTNLTIGDYNLDCIVNAESGVDRLIYSSASKTAAAHQRRSSHWWLNTGDNLTSIDLTPVSSATGTAKLYRRINPNITGDVYPFEVIKTFDVSGDYSAGDTLSGLTCDDYKMIKIEWLGSGATELRIQFNSDTTAHYEREVLQGSGASASASASSTEEYHRFKSGGDASEQSYSKFYLYPKSGEYRPSFNITTYDEDAIQFWGYWWPNTADEITSIKTYASSTATMSGQIRISVLRDHNFGAMTASSLLLNGSSQYLNAGNDVSLQTTGNTSAFIWVNSTNNPSSFETFFSKYNTTGNDRSWQIEVRGAFGNAIRVTLSSDGSAQQPIDATTTITAGTWYHIGFVYNGSTIKIYVNGVEENSVSYSSGIHNSSTADVIIGGLNQGGANLFDGSTQLASLFNTAITQTDIDELYNGGVPKQPWLLPTALKSDAVLLLPLNSETDSNEYSDYSGNANDATATGSPTITGDDLTIISGPDPSP